LTAIFRKDIERLHEAQHDETLYRTRLCVAVRKLHLVGHEDPIFGRGCPTCLAAMTSVASAAHVYRKTVAQYAHGVGNSGTTRVVLCASCIFVLRSHSRNTDTFRDRRNNGVGPGQGLELNFGMSAMYYKSECKKPREIASGLNVDGVIEGSVQRIDDKVRITVQHPWER